MVKRLFLQQHYDIILPIFQGAVFRAMYDYDAQDDDEVGFKDGDLVINPQQVGY